MKCIFRLYCNDCEENVKTEYQDSVPTECPVDSEHSIDSNSIICIDVLHASNIYSDQTLIFDSTQDWNVFNGATATLTLTANCTFDGPSNLTIGGRYILIINTSTYNVTSWNSIFKWISGSPPTWSANSKVIIEFIYDGTNLNEIYKREYS